MREIIAQFSQSLLAQHFCVFAIRRARHGIRLAYSPFVRLYLLTQRINQRSLLFRTHLHPRLVVNSRFWGSATNERAV